MPFIGMFINSAEGDPEISGRREAFLQGLGALPGLEIATRHGAAEYSTYQQKAAELIAFQSLVAGQKRLYFASCWTTLLALIQKKALPDPIVFAGMIDSPRYKLSQLASANPIYGFTSFGADLVAQWPGLLKQIAPNVTQVAVIFDKDPARHAYLDFYESIKKAAQAVNINTVSDIDARLADAPLQDAISEFKNSGGVGGLIVLGSTLTGTRRQTIIKLAQNYGLPAIYPNRLYASSGGLISRGAYLPELYRKAGSYANQILNGVPPKTPIVTNSTYETVVNRKAAMALGLTVPSTIAADFVIE